MNGTLKRYDNIMQIENYLIDNQRFTPPESGILGEGL